MIWGHWEQALKWNGGGNVDSVGYVNSCVSSGIGYDMLLQFLASYLGSTNRFRFPDFYI